MNETTNSAAPGRTTSALIVLAILGLPALYVALHRAPAQPVQASAQAQSAAAPLAELERLAQTQPTAANRLNLSQGYIQAAQYGRAITLLTSLVADDPHEALAWNNLCVAHMMQQEYKLAVQTCEAGVRTDGTVQLLRNNLKWAEDERAKTLAALADESRTPAAERNAAFYVAQGLNHEHLGEYDEAVAAWQQALRLDPGNAAALNNIGMVQMFERQFDAAEGSFRRAITLDPASQLARNNLAWALSEKNAAR